MRGRGGDLGVLVVTPLGAGGAGGIDRVMDQLRTPESARPDLLRVTLVASRGRWLIGSVWMLPLAAARIALGRLTRRVDVVHLNLASNASAWRKVTLSWVCRLLRIPYVVHLHGALFHKFWAGLSGPRKVAVDGLFRRAGAIVVLGAVWRDVVTARVPDVAERIFIVPNATQSRPRATGSGDVPSILFLGRLGARKGVPDLVQALAVLPADLRWTATIAGDGEIAETAAALRERGIEERVAVPGWVGAADVERLIDKADILVLPSYDENLPMSVIEGMAAGLAIVATPVGATADIIKHGRTGLLVEPGDVAALADALQQLAGDPALRRRLGEAAQGFQRRELDTRFYVDRLAEPWAYAAVQPERMAGNTTPRELRRSARS